MLNIFFKRLLWNGSLLINLISQNSDHVFKDAMWATELITSFLGCKVNLSLTNKVFSFL